MAGWCTIGCRQMVWNHADTERIRFAEPKPLRSIGKTGNLRAVQLLLGHTKVDSKVRYLGVELEDALSIAESIDL